jgi:hypothetical protein
MRIVSETHDYYDGVQAYGQDQSRVYVRISRKENFHFNVFPHLNTYYSSASLEHADQRLVGFCGKLYPVICMWMSTPGECTRLAYKCLYSISEVDAYVKKHWDKIRQEKYFGKKYFGKRKKYERRYNSTLFLQKDVKEFFRAIEAAQNTCEKWFVQGQSPIFIITYPTYKECKITWNASLKNVQFYKVLDPQTTYQELDMYLGGVLGLTNKRGRPSYQGQKMDDTVSDNDLMAAKGFDKWSFRKEPDR